MQRNIHRINIGTKYKNITSKSNIKIEENRKLNVSKHLYLWSRGKFNIMPIYQNNDYK